jgi:hypothetical protein
MNRLQVGGVTAIGRVNLMDKDQCKMALNCADLVIGQVVSSLDLEVSLEPVAEVS